MSTKPRRALLHKPAAGGTLCLPSAEDRAATRDSVQQDEFHCHKACFGCHHVPAESLPGADAIIESMDEPEAMRRILQALSLPGVIDVHTHFMPKNVMDKVWQYFDSAGPLTGRPWPITYRSDEQDRLRTLRSFGVLAFTSLVYAHKPDMAAWLNQWAAGFAVSTPDCLKTATFYPEPGAPAYVRTALESGTQVFKAHVQVGGYDPADPLLDDVWGLIEDAGTPVVIHCGSGPAPGAHTGPGPVRTVLRRHPRLRLIIAHMGLPEYSEFLDLCADFEQLHLDTTMAFTRFTEESMPFPPNEYGRLREMGHRILFGSDFPNIPYGYADAMSALTELPGIDDTWLRNVFHDNGARLFGSPRDPSGLPSAGRTGQGKAAP